MLKIVTFTGADDSIDPNELKSVTSDFPFVEWGLLLSRNSQGNNRFPTNNFLEDVEGMEGLKLSGHLCGSYVRELLVGNAAFINEIPSWNMFQRVQINTHGTTHKYDSTRLAAILKQYPGKEFIFQFDNANRHILDAMIQQGVKNISTLFDLSHGAGVLPEEWPEYIDGLKCGYAGGLSPKNLKENIERVESKAGDRETWVDMETHVRSDDDRKFDIFKCVDCLQISSPFIK